MRFPGCPPLPHPGPRARPPFGVTVARTLGQGPLGCHEDQHPSCVSKPRSAAPLIALVLLSLSAKAWFGADGGNVGWALASLSHVS